MNILITGAKGFIGKHLVKRLSKNHSVTEHEWGDQLPDLWHYKAVIHTGAISSTTYTDCLLYTSPSPRDRTRSRMPSSA